METIKEVLSKIKQIGIDFDMKLIGDVRTGGFLRQINEYDFEGEKSNWLVLREMGTFCTRLDNKEYQKRYSDDVSTIIFEQYFLYNKISYLFEELNRITKGSFKYEVIDEFQPIYNSNNEVIKQEFWANLDRLKGNSEYICKYLIMGKKTEILYKFEKWSWTSLNPDFIVELLSIIEKDLVELNINCLVPEEFITFVLCNESAKSQLKMDLGIHFYEKKMRTSQEEGIIRNIQELEDKKPEIQKNENKKWWEFWK
ncbi:MAG: hypothetical protein MRY78_06080 [Saprospiraceae bacterium]|nr:hypothetical protein [Saprospiraceae bacterium]